MMLSSLLAVAMAGCTTVTPDEIRAKQPSWDGNAQNSGVIAFLPGHGAIVTRHWRERYNDMIRIYGSRFMPALTLDAGIIPNADETFVVNAEGLANFGKMNLWRKGGK